MIASLAAAASTFTCDLAVIELMKVSVKVNVSKAAQDSDDVMAEGSYNKIDDLTLLSEDYLNYFSYLLYNEVHWQGMNLHNRLAES